jgi:hypothetical protein
VRRQGDRLEFIGAVPWVGKQVTGSLKGRRVSFGDQPPKDVPEPPSWVHFGPEGIFKHEPNAEKTWSPPQYHKEARLLAFNLRLVWDLVSVSLFFFVVTMLLRFKRVELPAFGPLRVLARCLIPAGVYGGLIAFFGTGHATNVSIAVFLLVLGMNVLLFVMGAKPTPEEPLPFEV